MKLVREVATFMQFYPAYKLRDVMDEYALSFFRLLEEGYRLRYQNMVLLAQVHMAPEMKPDAWRSFVAGLENAGKDISDILTQDDDYSGIEQLKKLL